MKTKSTINVWNNTFIILGIICIFIGIHSCKKEGKVAMIDSDSVMDNDHNVYKTVKIGKQWWMAENLRTKTYRNGDSINYIGITNQYDSERFDSAQWRLSADKGAYCILGTDSASISNNGKNYGFLYNWYVIKDSRNIAPAGWHVPTDADWKELEIYLGMNKDTVEKVNWRGANEGSKLKRKPDGSVKALQAWLYDLNLSENNLWGTNESGFSALGGSCKMFNGKDGSPGILYTGFWWSASEFGNSEAWYRYLDYNKTNVFRFYGPKTYGFSIRCVKDTNVNE